MSIQLFVVMGLVTRSAPPPQKDTVVAVPLVYAFLSNKSEGSYKAVFDAINREAARVGIPNITP